MKPRVVILGGGFGGLYAAQSLKGAPFDVTLVDRRNFHLFQPLLYQVATGALSPADIASPLRYVLRRQKNARVLLAEVLDLDPGEREAILTDGRIPYDDLIVATGSRPHYFGHPEWEAIAPGLKTIEDATEVRRRVLSAFEAAEREESPEKRRAWLNFVVIGGGPTGVELSGSLVELARDTLTSDFRRIDTREARIVLVESAERVLPKFPPELSGKAEGTLRRLGVEVHTGTLVTELRPDELLLQKGGTKELLHARTILWSAGVKASSLGEVLAGRLGAKLDRMGRVIVEPDLSVPGHPEIFVIGDLAHYAHQGGQPLPGLAPVAMQQGRYVARLLRERRRGRSSGPFHYSSKGELATIGRAAAVAQLGRLRLSGFRAWIAWVFVHIYYLIEFENKFLVLLQWAWSFFTWNRSARLITGRSPPPFRRGDVAAGEKDGPR